MAPEQATQGDSAGRQSLSPGKRKRLQQCFAHANTQMSQENYDYAAELFTQCVAGDPGNLIYLQSFFSNLKKKYDNNKKGSNLAMFRVGRCRSAAKKACSQQDWAGAIKAGLEGLKLNPWDVATLSIMADAAKELGNQEVRLTYLKMALEANPKDPEVNILCATALRELGHFDQAISCWHRVEQAKPGDEEAARQIASLAVEKTIAKGGYEDPNRQSESLKGVGPVKTAGTEVTPEQRLERELAKHPDDVSKHMELAELHLTRERYDKAEEVLARAYELSGGDEDVRERWEDAQMRGLRQRLAKAQRQAKQSGSEQDAQKAEELKQQVNAKELEIHKNRVKRYPNNLAFRFDLAERYRVAGQYSGAIAEYQQARNDPRRKGMCLLRLGECFQRIKQYRLAMSHYEEAIQEIPDRDADNKKLVLYLAGRLAIGLKNYDRAENYLATLAGLDFAYRDVSTLLDKITRLRENGDEDEDEEEAGPDA